MRTSLSVACCAVALLALTHETSAFASVVRPTAVAKEAETELGKLMGQMGRHFKVLKKEVGDATRKDANIAHFNAIAELAGKCKEKPSDTVKTDADRKLYAEQLDEVAATAKAGAKSLEAGKLDEAKKAVDALKKLMSEGHKKFKKED